MSELTVPSRVARLDQAGLNTILPTLAAKGFPPKAVADLLTRDPRGFLGQVLALTPGQQRGLAAQSDADLARAAATIADVLRTTGDPTVPITLSPAPPGPVTQVKCSFGVTRTPAPPGGKGGITIMGTIEF